jgi:UDP-N-acetylmuramoylalanine--D-glutamate ligase
MTDVLDVNNKRVLVVGLGKSGVASAIFLHERGARVTVSDSKSEEQLRDEIPTLLDRGIAVESGGHGERTFRQQDLIVVSPGVPADAPPLQQARALGIPVVGEIELAARFLKGKIVGITGSNGKTTTTALTGAILSRGGHTTLVGGNIGTPAISLVAQSNDETWVVLEISSFQLETIERFRPHVAVMLNVTPDHLDRHGSMEAYTAAKRRIFENQTAGDFAVLNADDPVCVEMSAWLRSQLYWFTRKIEPNSGAGNSAFVRGDRIFVRDTNGERDIMSLDDIPLKGAHNVENVLAAVCAGVIAGCEPALIRAAVMEFKAVEHRLEHVATIGGVAFYNDSKATNVDATIKAVESFPACIHLILGGKDKGAPYTPLVPLLKERARRVYTIGKAAPIIEEQLAGAVDIVSCGTLEVALRKAAEAAVAGDVVLLAPACASFDQFDNYQHRGRVFKDLVQALAARRSASGG